MSDTSDEAITAGVRRVLCERGPMSEDELLGVLTAEGVDLGSEPDAMLAAVLDEEDEPFMPLADRRWAWLPGLLEGRIFTHRLSAVEAAHDIISGLDPDLAPLAMLTEYETYQRLSDGSPITEVCPFHDGEVHDSDVLTARGVPTTAFGNDTELLVLPLGRFAALGVGAGDLVGLRVSAHGFELAAIPDPAPCDDITTMLAGLLDQHPDRPEMLDIAVWTVCADHNSLFRQAGAPLGELLSVSGLACEGEWVACSGFDFAAWQVADGIATIKERYELDEDEALAVLATVGLYEHTRDAVEAVMAALDSGDEDDEHELSSIASQLPTRLDPTPAQAQERSRDRKPVRAALEPLADPAVASAVLAEIDFDHDLSAVALGAFAESAEPLAPRAARPALRWLRANAYERLGDIEQAEASLLAAESLDPSWPLTLMSLARYASDRGDAERGLLLLRRAGAPADHQLVELLEHFRAAPRPGLGRNDRCWCGSGRKYKACHLHREQLPLEERAAWLYQKAGSSLQLAGPSGRFSSLLMEAAAARARCWDPDAVARALDDGLAFDVVLFEGGAFADFLATRGSLLPDDERLLAGQWLLVQRSVHEVLSVSPGRGFTLRDVRTGDVQQVRERAASSQVKVGQLYCGRVVPAGDTMQIFGGMEPVSLGERDELIALLDNNPDPVELVAALSRRFAPPVLQNTEGEPLMICDATLRVDDPVALSQALDDAYDRDDDQPDGTLVWYEFVITDGMQRIRAHLELRGDQLDVHANSTACFERVLATIASLDPSATRVQRNPSARQRHASHPTTRRTQSHNTSPIA